MPQNNQQAVKGRIMQVRMVDPDNHKETEILFHNGDKEEYVWNTGDLLGHFLVSPYPWKPTASQYRQDY